MRVYCRGTLSCHEGTCLHLGRDDNKEINLLFSNPLTFYGIGECRDLLFNRSRPSNVRGSEKRERLLLQRANCTCNAPAFTPAMTIVTVLAWRGSSFCVLGVETLVGRNYKSTFLIGKKCFIFQATGSSSVFPQLALVSS